MMSRSRRCFSLGQRKAGCSDAPSRG